MDITEDDVREILESLFDRCARARAMGGIALQDAENGMTVPDGWKLDWQTDYYVPRPLDETLN